MLAVIVMAAPAASAMPADGTVAPAAASLSPVVKAAVVCARERVGNKIRTWSCPNGNTCVNRSGQWKCRPPGIAPMACSVCYNNYDRDKRACNVGNLNQQAACVNAALATWKACLAHCQ